MQTADTVSTTINVVTTNPVPEPTTIIVFVIVSVFLYFIFNKNNGVLDEGGGNVISLSKLLLPIRRSAIAIVKKHWLLILILITILRLKSLW